MVRQESQKYRKEVRNIHYLATIHNGWDRNAMSFNTMTAAEQWLDENNNKLEHLTTIETFDENWQKIDGLIYTEEKK